MDLYYFPILCTISLFLAISFVKECSSIILDTRGGGHDAFPSQSGFESEDFNDDNINWHKNVNRFGVSNDIPRLDNRGRIDEFFKPRAKCDKRIKIANGVARVRDRGTLVRFQCIFGFHMLGASVAICIKGQWSDPAPTCVREGCRTMPIPLHGSLRQLYGGGVAVFTCNYGFLLQGERILTCDGVKWNGTAPTCAEIPPITLAPPVATFSPVQPADPDIGTSEQTTSEVTEGSATTNPPDTKISEDLPPAAIDDLNQDNNDINETNTTTNPQLLPISPNIQIPSPTDPVEVTTAETSSIVETPNEDLETLSPISTIATTSTTSTEMTIDSKLSTTEYVTTPLPPLFEPEPPVATTQMATTQPMTSASTTTTPPVTALTWDNDLSGEEKLIPTSETPITESTTTTEEITSTMTTTTTIPPMIITKKPKPTKPIKVKPTKEPYITKKPIKVKTTTTTIAPILPDLLVTTSSTPPTPNSLPEPEPEEVETIKPTSLIYSDPAPSNRARNAKTIAETDSLEKVAPIIPERLGHDEESDPRSSRYDFGHLLVVIGVTLIAIGLVTIVGGSVTYYWRRNKGIARPNQYDLDGRTLSTNDGNDEFLWLYNRDSGL